MTKLPKHGRIVTVQTLYIDESSYAPAEVFYVAIDDDARAMEAVKEALDFAANDDRLVEVAQCKLKENSMLGLKMNGGEIKKA